VLNANSSKRAKDVNFKFGVHDPRKSANMTPEKNSRKGNHVCDFLLVRHSNVAPFRRFCTFYSTVILGVLQLHQIAHVGVSKRIDLKLFGREIIFEVLQPMCSRYLNVTDGHTTCNLITALCVASRGKNSYI